VDTAVCPPFPYLAVVAEALQGSPVAVGAQDLFWEIEDGAFTGEVSAKMLCDAGCAYAIVGHSERRHVLGETDETVRRKLGAALDGGLSPILCVGELLEEREAGRTESVVERHVTEGLKGLDAAAMAKVTLAYEPVWAIGTGKTATPEQAQEVHAFIRSLVAVQFGRKTADALRIQYGGSVKPGNAADLLGQPDIDGALVGGASLKADSFQAIVASAG
jgi:triosephosphate isomerase